MRDQLAMVLEMALVHGQVGAEVHKLFLYDLLLPWFELSLQRGNNRGFNRTPPYRDAVGAGPRCRRGCDGSAVLAVVGEVAPVQAAYIHRPGYRWHRIWFLGAKARIA